MYCSTEKQEKSFILSYVSIIIAVNRDSIYLSIKLQTFFANIQRIRGSIVITCFHEVSLLGIIYFNYSRFESKRVVE